MVKDFQIAKFFRALVAAGGQLGRSDLSVRVLGRNWSAKQLDGLLAIPLLAGLVTTTKAKTKGSRRVPLRYVLTAAGWEIARTWQLPVSVDRIAPEETLRQFQILVVDGHPFASALSKDAAAWRTHQEAQRREREAKAAAAQEKKRERELTHPLVKHPSKDRTRSSRDLTQRANWFAAKKAERAPMPVISPTPLTPRPSFRDDSGVTRHGGGGFAKTPVTPLVMPQRFHDEEPHLDGATLALIRKISAAGYQHCIGADGRVLFNNTERLTPQEWIKRNPGVID